MLNFDFSFFSPANWPLFYNFLFKGFVFSVTLTIIATIGGILLGTVIALMRLSSITALRWIATIYVDLLRSVPLMMVLLWFFLGMRTFGAETSAIITFVVFEAAYFSEIVRAGIKSVPQGQAFAGEALGMTHAQTMRLIILPQAYRNMIPIFLTQIIILFQDTSLVYIIGAHDLLGGFRSLGSVQSKVVETYIMAASIYFIICFTLSKIARAYQKRIAIIR